MVVEIQSMAMEMAAAQIRSLTMELRDNMNRMTRVAMELEESWKSETARVYVARLLCVRREYDQLEQFFRDYADVLERISYEYQRQEEELAAKVRSL